MAETKLTFTPVPVVAQVSRIVAILSDRIMGDRNDAPLFVAALCSKALLARGVRSRVVYGQAAWLEVLENHQVVWAGCWGENFYFWLETEFGEIVDLNSSVAHRKRPSDTNLPKSIYSPPMLWSKDVPVFYRYQPEGVAELSLDSEADKKKFESAVTEIQEKLALEEASDGDLDFANEPIICPNRQLLDDSKGTFRLFERAVQVSGIPEPPI